MITIPFTQEQIAAAEHEDDLWDMLIEVDMHTIDFSIAPDAENHEEWRKWDNCRMLIIAEMERRGIV